MNLTTKICLVLLFISYLTVYLSYDYYKDMDNTDLVVSRKITWVTSLFSSKEPEQEPTVREAGYSVTEGKAVLILLIGAATLALISLALSIFKRFKHGNFTLFAGVVVSSFALVVGVIYIIYHFGLQKYA